MSACGNVADYAQTEHALCRELERDLPTSSPRDTEQSKYELANFLDVFYADCGDVLRSE